YQVELPLIGDFQATNALVAAALAIGTGAAPAKVFEALGRLVGPRGRMELVARHPKGAPIFVDYAHTPDALRNVLTALRPYTDNRLSVVFGCGGDRDPGKRVQMGRIVSELADATVITDDNPRNEDPESIRANIIDAVPQARNIGDRAEAIRFAISELHGGDVLVIAGKGHESGQIAGGVLTPFDDAEEVRKAVADLQKDRNNG
ncbi:MAG: UDP-N-acetylmuramoyl-L-alanyl-D-glutamate--2,6-diaminopimelate ligase, partial [Rhodospirillales bacterium]|nr:UDP-N-acetylmuramoyl-L-alanyl-D-glutamate--2,6-diaminopimelate ligase [Rhodospirillales bacterium]